MTTSYHKLPEKGNRFFDRRERDAGAVDCIRWIVSGGGDAS